MTGATLGVITSPPGFVSSGLAVRVPRRSVQPRCCESQARQRAPVPDAVRVAQCTPLSSGLSTTGMPCWLSRVSWCGQASPLAVCCAAVARLAASVVVGGPSEHTRS
ncbi:MAG: hypothetical protein WDW38_003978 [Sanguina aurantia]